MKAKLLTLVLTLSVLLSGCGWMNGGFVSVEPHQVPRQSGHTDTVTASNYREFLAALKQIIASGPGGAQRHAQ